MSGSDQSRSTKDPLTSVAKDPGYCQRSLQYEEEPGNLPRIIRLRGKYKVKYLELFVLTDNVVQLYTKPTRLVPMVLIVMVSAIPQPTHHTHVLLHKMCSCRSRRNKGCLKGGTHKETLLPRRTTLEKDQVEGVQVS